MYCPGCGTQIEADLNFCKKCGSRVAGGESASIAANLSQALGYIPGVGVIGFVFVVFLTIRADVPLTSLMLILFLYLATLFAFFFVILRQTSSLAGRKKNGSDTPPGSDNQPMLSPAITGQLGEHHDQPNSVTEQTTRALDAVLIERK